MILSLFSCLINTQLLFTNKFYQIFIFRQEETMFQAQTCKKLVQTLWEKSALPSLMKFIEIPNLSRTYDAEWNTNGKLIQAANHIQNWIQSVGIKGLTTEIIHDEGYSPLLFTQVKGDIPVTVFFYNHHDKQPDVSGWEQGLSGRKPVVKNGKLYGRGAADDGYAPYSSILAIKTAQEMGVKIPRCVMITEGDEQSGSIHMNHYLPKLKQKIGDPTLFFTLDSGAFDYNRLWLSSSLRGNLVGTLKVSTLKDGVHSGDSSGIVPNCFRIAKILLGRVQNPLTGQIHEAFHVNIPSEFYKPHYQLAKIKQKQAIKQFAFLEGCQTISSNPLTCVLNRTWKPTLTVTGQTGFPQVERAGNVNLPEVELRFSLRLPPTLDSDIAYEKLKQLLLTNPPYNARVQLKDVRVGFGWTAANYKQYLQEALEESSKIFYQADLLKVGEGVSVPLMNALSKNWPQGQFIIAGVLGPNSNAHGPNESLDLQYTKRLICCMTYILAKTSTNYDKKFC